MKLSRYTTPLILFFVGVFGVLVGVTSFFVLEYGVNHVIIMLVSLVCGAIFGRLLNRLRDTVWAVFMLSSAASVFFLWLASRDYLYSYEIIHSLYIFGIVFLCSFAGGLLLSRD